MSELKNEVIPTENIQANKDVQPSSSSTSALVPIEKDKTKVPSKADHGTQVEPEHFFVFRDADIPKGAEDVEISTQNYEIETGSNVNYNQDNSANQLEDDDVVALVELNVHTSGSDNKSFPPSESSNDNDETFKTAMEISSELPLEGSQDSSEIKSEVSDKRGLKRKSIYLEDESFANNFEGMYTCDTAVVPKKKDEDSALNENKNNMKLLHYQVQCVNLHCQSGYGLEVAPVFVLTYFGQTRKRNILQKVCRECFKMAFRHQQDVIYRLKAHKSVLKANFPPQKNDVVVMDPIEEEYEEELLPKAVTMQVRKYLPKLLAETVQKYDLDFQLDEASKILSKKFQDLEEESMLIEGELNSLEKTLREARLLIYKDFTPKIKHLPTLTIIEPKISQEASLPKTAPRVYSRVNKTSGSKSKKESSSQEVAYLAEIDGSQKKLPSYGALPYPPLNNGDHVFIMKFSFFGPWVKGRILDVIIQKAEQPPVYRVRFDTSHRAGLTKIVSGKYLAYSRPSPVRYPVGTRVIALYRNEESPCKSAYFVGMIAEPPKYLNKFRYLVFFDDGYAQYVIHEKILLVCECSKSVYEDVHPETKDFIKKYLEQYPERPMVKLMQGQVVRTEWNGKWWLARVMDIDCSLVKMYFDADGRSEWMYRGSNRLGPLYSELVAAAAKKDVRARHRSLGIATLKKRNMPYVEYNVDQDDQVIFSNIAGKYVGTKSTNGKGAQEADGTSGSTEPDDRMEYETKGYIRSIDTSGRIVGKTFTPHQCGPFCTEWTYYSDKSCTGIGPLAIPLFFGFERQTVKYKGKHNIFYRAPCGRRLRTMIEVHRYLRLTKTPMGLDFFDFDFTIHALEEFHLERDMFRTQLKDISYGLEKNPITCVNEIDHSWPAFMDYSTSRIPQEGVKICYDDEFLVRCDCDDDCQDKAKCACWQLTIQGTKLNGVVDSSVGYKYKRLLEPVTTGIYECNHRCKCSATCLNRVAQLPLQLNLQVFRTLKKGWGLRTVNDLPQGTFICIYAGRLHTEQSANDDGRMYGDEYLAELDYIEVVERFKEGYESDVVEPSDKNEEDEDESEEKFMSKDDKDYVPEGLRRLPQVQNIVTTRARRKRSSAVERFEKEIAKEKEVDGADAGNVNKEGDGTKKKSEGGRRRKYKSLREMFGDGIDDCYVMDAKSIGNIGRYLNHSCQPNVFVQNVFVDSHDVRFPWVSFFALTHIKAGTELTWDYNYDVGSVPNKILYCYCNKSECRGRLL